MIKTAEKKFTNFKEFSPPVLRYYQFFRIFPLVFGQVIRYSEKRKRCCAEVVGSTVVHVPEG